MSGRRELPAHLRAFLYSCIETVEQLEILLLLQRSTREWTARMMAQEVGVLDARARAWLDALVARGLVRAIVREETMYVFQPSNATMLGYCDELALAYDRARLDVVRFVAMLPPLPIRSFARAFRLREPE